MFKKALIILLSSFIGIVGSPDFLIASDDVNVLDLDQTKVVQTVIPEPEPEPEPAPAAATPVYNYVAPAAPAAPVAVAPAPAPAPTNHLDLAGRSLTVEYTSSTAVDAGGVVKFYNNKFLYGHNSGAVFGFLPSVGIGQTFSLTYNGVVTHYRVSNKVEYAKTGATTLGIGNTTYKMGHVANGYDPNEVRHSIVMMTCSGVSYGNGDASHRLVLFADAI